MDKCHGNPEIIELTFDRSKMHEGQVEKDHEGCQNSKDDPILVAKLDAEFVVGSMSGVTLLTMRHDQGGVHGRILKVVYTEITIF